MLLKTETSGKPKSREVKSFEVCHSQWKSLRAGVDFVAGFIAISAVLSTTSFVSVHSYAESLASTRILKHSVESSRGSCGENLAWASYDQSGTYSIYTHTHMLNILFIKLNDFVYMPSLSSS